MPEGDVALGVIQHRHNGHGRVIGQTVFLRRQPLPAIFSVSSSNSIKFLGPSSGLTVFIFAHLTQ